MKKPLTIDGVREKLFANAIEALISIRDSKDIRTLNVASTVLDSLKRLANTHELKR